MPYELIETTFVGVGFPKHWSRLNKDATGTFVLFVGHVVLEMAVFANVLSY